MRMMRQMNGQMDMSWKNGGMKIYNLPRFSLKSSLVCSSALPAITSRTLTKQDYVGMYVVCTKCMQQKKKGRFSQFAKLILKCFIFIANVAKLTF